jgi:hypothetical protein
MRARPAATVATAFVGFICAGMASAAQAGPSVAIRNAVARVTVIAENRSDVKVEFLTTNPDLPIHVATRGDRVIIDGDLRHNRIHGCRTHGGRPVVSVRDVGEVTWEKMPQVVIRTPMAVDVGADGAVFGSVGRADSVDLANAGCGDWTVANVKGQLKISNAGSGDTRTGSAAEIRVNVAGSGDVRTAAIGGPVSVNIAGSGDVRVGSIAGPLAVSVAGSGDVVVGGGNAPEVHVNIAGSGDTDFAGTAGEVSANIMGSGDVRVAVVTGQIHKAIMGSGSVIVGH